MGLRADLGEASTLAFAFTLALSFFLILALRSSLETDALRLRLRPWHPLVAQETSLSSWMVESARKRARLVSVVCLPS